MFNGNKEGDNIQFHQTNGLNSVRNTFDTTANVKLFKNNVGVIREEESSEGNTVMTDRQMGHMEGKDK